LTDAIKAVAVLPLAAALLGTYAFGQNAPAPPHQNISYGFEGDFNSAYIWRGIALNNRPVLQPSAWISASQVTLEIWSALNLTHTSEIESFQTAYLSLAYSRAWKKLRIEPALEGYLNRRFEQFRDPNTVEATLSVSYAAGPLRLFTSHAWDVMAHKGSYFGEAGLGYEKSIARENTLAVSLRSGWASAQFNEVYIGVSKPASNFAGAESSFRYSVTPNLHVRPHLQFIYTTDRRLRDYLMSPTIVNFGVSLGVEF
jgi:hypothetical protein